MKVRIRWSAWIERTFEASSEDEAEMMAADNDPLDGDYVTDTWEHISTEIVEK